MTGKILLLIIFAAALLFFCWMLTSYWLRKRRQMLDYDVGKLRIGSVTAFAMTNFWKKVDRAKDIPKDTVKSEFASVRMEEDLREEKVIVKSDIKKKDQDILTARKKYKIKENM